MIDLGTKKMDRE